MPVVQLGLFGENHPVSPDCDDCERPVSGKPREGLDGETLCVDCFESADLLVCPNCDETVSREDCSENPNGELWCDSCIENGTTECNDCGGRTWNDDVVSVQTRRGYRRSTDPLCETCADRTTVTCDDCGEVIYRDDSYRTASGEDICDSCYGDNYFTCEDCGEIYHNDHLVYHRDYAYCEDCRPDNYDFDPSGFRNRSGRITEIGSARCYGVELETDECEGYDALEGSGAWGAKDDCTVNGKEFYSDILNGDEGLDAIREWARLAKRNGWDAGYNAGYHLHLDMRNESDDSLYAIAYAYRATEDVWLSFVESRRSNGSYSHRCEWRLQDLTDAADNRSFYSWSNRGTRYNWINTCAFSQHSTFEVRAHQGTCDGLEILNWVKANTRFADWASTKGLAGVQKALGNLSNSEKFDLIAREAWQDDELREFYAEKAERYS